MKNSGFTTIELLIGSAIVIAVVVVVFGMQGEYSSKILRISKRAANYEVMESIREQLRDQEACSRDLASGGFRGLTITKSGPAKDERAYAFTSTLPEAARISGVRSLKLIRSVGAKPTFERMAWLDVTFTDGETLRMPFAAEFEDDVAGDVWRLTRCSSILTESAEEFACARE